MGQTERSEAWERTKDRDPNDPLTQLEIIREKSEREGVGIAHQYRIVREALSAPDVTECEWWKPDPEEEFYETDCGSAWEPRAGFALEELPTMKFCSNCGGRIRIAAAPDPED